MTNYNKAPYYDDINTKGIDGLTPAEKFQRILFRPGHAVQARELTQIQSLLQSQISHIGNHFFNEGSLVLPGHITHNKQLDYVIVQEEIPSGEDPAVLAKFYKELIGQELYQFDHTEDSVPTPLTAQIQDTYYDGTNDKHYLYLTYTSSNPERIDNPSNFIIDDLVKYNSTGRVLKVTQNNIKADGTVLKGSKSSITDGIFYINKMFVVVNTHSFISDPIGEYSDSDSLDYRPDYSIGLHILEEDISRAEDPTLGDNALGTNNSKAAGANRLKVTATLVSLDTLPEVNFIELLRIRKGKVIKKVDRTSYNILGKELARRTSDESGDYVIKPFTLDIASSTDGNTFIGSLGKSKAYVKGVEIETIAATPIDIPTANNSVLTPTTLIAENSQYIIVDDVQGSYTLDNTAQINAGGEIIATCKISHITTEPTIINKLRLYVIDYVATGFALEGDIFIEQVTNDETVLFHADINTLNDIKLNDKKSSSVYELKNTGVSLLNTADISLLDNTGQAEYYIISKISGQVTADGSATFPVGVYTIDPTKIPGSIVMNNANVTLGGPSISPHTVTEGVVSTGENSIIINNIPVSTAVENDYVELSIPVKVADSQGSYKTKTLEELTLPIISVSAAPYVFKQGNNNIYDVYDIISITNGDDSDTDTTDYTSKFVFDNGYTDHFYKECTLTLKDSSDTAIATLPPTLSVRFRYFRHAGSGKFFSRESYSISDNSALPSYYSEKYGKVITLGNTLDFRPIEGNTLITIEPNSLINIDIALASNRKDIIILDTSGNFSVIKGTASKKPTVKTTPKNAVKLYELLIPANSNNAAEIEIKRINNKRYTMRDVGKIESRVDRLEYYTSLTLLESQTMSEDIGGRLKSGFLVDDFKTHARGDTTHIDYKCSVWPALSALGPRFIEKNFPLIWTDHPGGVLTAEGYVENVLNVPSLNIKKTGDLITLDYSEQVEFDTLDATNFINVNPFNVFDFTGNMVLSPSSDDWKDTNRRPNVVFEQNSLYDAMLPLIDQDSIGTVWNSWETHWTGVSGSATEQTTPAWIGNKLTSFITESQTRAGIQTTLTETTEITDMGDRVVSVDLAPFMRTRLISFKATGLKPNTILHASFDDIDVSRFCKTDEVFIDHTIAGDYPDVQMTENYGSNWRNIPFITEDQHPGGTGELISDASGAITGSFWIPNLSNINFTVGTKVFRLSDIKATPNLQRQLETTTASAEYSATGLIENIENTSLSTRLPVITSTEVFGARDQVTEDVRYRDPLAQSFVLDRSEYPEGLFASAIDVYFKQKDLNIPITLEIREMQNGIPTQKVVNFSRVELTPSEVIEIQETQYGSTHDPETIKPFSTSFKFNSLVHLAPGIEYCFVLMANSDNYEIWYHRIGETSLITSEISPSQLHTGVMFKSQNASTWEPDSTADIPFSLTRAVFSTEPGIVNLKENAPEYIKLSHNPISIEAVTTEPQTKITISHPKHGFILNDSVTLSGISSTNNTSLSGFPLTSINTEHSIKGINNLDEYYIELDSSIRTNNNDNLGGNATWTTMQLGGGSVLTTYSIDYSEFYFGISQIEPIGTDISWTSIHTDKSNNALNTILLESNTSVGEYDKMFTVTSAGNDECTFKGSLETSSDLVSPIIDLERMSVIAIEPIIDSEENPLRAGYVTKPVVLESNSSSIKVILDAYSPASTSVKVKYQISDGAWSDFDQVVTTNNSISEFQFEANGLELFTTFRIKIEMYSETQYIIPYIRNFRAIAGI